MLQQPPFRWVAVSVFALALLGPAPSLPAGDDAPPADDPPAETPPADTPPPAAAERKNPLLEPNDEQLQAEAEFLRAIEKSVSTADGAALDQNIDAPVLVRQACRGLGVNSKEMAAMTGEFRKSFPLGKVAAELLKKNGGTYRLIKVRTADGQRRALFRMYTDGRLNFHDLVLSKNARGHYQVADIYVYITGEMISATFRRALEVMLSKDHPDRLKWVPPGEKAVLDHLKDLDDLLKLQAAKKYPEALKAYQAFPPELQKEKSTLLIAVGIAQNCDEKSFTDLIDLYAQLFPADPAVGFVGLDGLYLLKKYDRVLAALDRLDRQVGDDAVLKTYRGNCLLGLDKYTDAVKQLQAAIALEKKLPLPYRLLAGVACTHLQYDLAVETMTAYEKEMGQPFGDLTREAQFKEFLNAPQGKKWVADHPKPK